MFGKRGISGIVVTVILIFVALGALTIILINLNPTIKKNLEATNCADLADSFRFSKDAITCFDDETSIAVSRNSEFSQGFAVIFKKGEFEERINVKPGSSSPSLKNFNGEYNSPLTLPSLGENVLYVYKKPVDRAELYPLTDSGLLCSLADKIELLPCSEQEMSILQSSSGGGGGGGGDGGPGKEEGNNFRFFFESDGLLKELNWTSDGSSWRRVIWDELGRYPGSLGIRYYLHSYHSFYNPAGQPIQPASQEGWSYVILPTGIQVNESHTAISYQKVSEDSNSVKIIASTSAISVVDDIDFTGDRITIKSTVTNNLAVPIRTRIPILFGGLQMGNIGQSGAIQLADTGLSRLRAWNGGEIESNFNSTGNVPYSYPSHGTFSPLSVLWDRNITMGIQYPMDLSLPDYVEFSEHPKVQQTPVARSFIHAELLPGESKTFTLVVRFAQTRQDSWKDTLTPYRNWFYSNYNNGVPEYCPTGPFAYFVGNNIGSPQYNPVTKRYAPNTQFMNVFAAGQTLNNTENLELPYYGIWAATLWSAYLCPECATSLSNSNTSCTQDICCEFSPNSITLDPNLDVAINYSKLNQAASSFKDKGSSLFWYTRPCSIIDLDNPLVSELDIPLNGTYVNVLDLRDESVRNAKFAEYDFLYSHGVKNFYMDYLSCPGEQEFIDELWGRYEDTTFMAREGATDKLILKVAQVPIVKFSNKTGLHSQLIRWLTPEASYYLGNANEPLNDSEMDYALSNGYQPIVSNTLANVNFTNMNKYKGWMCQGYQNQLEKYNSYGGEIEGCLPPVKPSYC